MHNQTYMNKIPGRYYLPLCWDRLQEHCKVLGLLIDIYLHSNQLVEQILIHYFPVQAAPKKKKRQDTSTRTHTHREREVTKGGKIQKVQRKKGRFITWINWKNFTLGNNSIAKIKFSTKECTCLSWSWKVCGSHKFEKVISNYLNWIS